MVAQPPFYFTEMFMLAYMVVNPNNIEEVTGYLAGEDIYASLEDIPRKTNWLGKREGIQLSADCVYIPDRGIVNLMDMHNSELSKLKLRAEIELGLKLADRETRALYGHYD